MCKEKGFTQQKIEIQSLNDFFVELNRRKIKTGFFYRINGFHEEIKEFLIKYYETARHTGVIIEGRIPNPDMKHLSYYEEIMGMDFRFDVAFFDLKLRKWLPRMRDNQRRIISEAIYDILWYLKNTGKNENILKNVYIKFMCWLYYKFEQTVNQLGNTVVPKILYEGTISQYELLFLHMLSQVGCDVILLQYHGDEKYLQLDPQSLLSHELKLSNMQSFPKEFNLHFLQMQVQISGFERKENGVFNEKSTDVSQSSKKDFCLKTDSKNLYGNKPMMMPCTNAWIKEKVGLDIIKFPLSYREPNNHFFHNVFFQMNGVEDKVTYLNELYQFYLELKQQKRAIVIIEHGLENPTIEEISKIKRNTYTKYEQLLSDLQMNISYPSNMELQRIMIKSFIDVLLEETKREKMTVQKLTNKAVYLLCWLKRYQQTLFLNWKLSDISCFIVLGTCKNENEALFLKFLARLPVDVLLFNPALEVSDILKDEWLYEINYEESLRVSKFPTESGELKMGTTAYYAERELDTLMYQGSGIYRNHQYQKATSVILQTMYEEIAILWNQEVKYRQNFSVNENNVNLPVLYAKVSGVKDGNISEYWVSIKKLLSKETLWFCSTDGEKSMVSSNFKRNSFSYITSEDFQIGMDAITQFFKNGKLQKNKIKAHKEYSYGFLREEMQEHILDKLQLLIEQRLIKGTFENGTEYTIIAVALNMKKEILRLIQTFDFTKINPKFVYIHTTEKNISLEDSILMAFLNLLGFDIVFFVPTGYRIVEKYYNKILIYEHQIGEYCYDLTVPNFDNISLTTHMSWKDRIFRRGV